MSTPEDKLRAAFDAQAEKHAAERDALRADAQRYRWLTADHHKHDTRAEVYTVAMSLNTRSKSHIDAAIDAARSKA